MRNAPSPRWIEGRGGERERWASSGSARRVRRVRLAVARRQGGAPRDERRRREVHSSHPFVGCRASRSCCDGARGGGRGGVSGRGARFQNRWRSRRGDARRRHAELFGHVVLATPQAHPLARVVGTGFLELLSRRHGVARHRRALWHRGATADGFSYECERPSLSMAYKTQGQVDFSSEKTDRLTDARASSSFTV